MSWWICPPSEFYGRARAEQARLSTSYWGQRELLSTAIPLHLHRKTRKQRQQADEECD